MKSDHNEVKVVANITTKEINAERPCMWLKSAMEKALEYRRKTDMLKMEERKHTR